MRVLFYRHAMHKLVAIFSLVGALLLAGCSGSPLAGQSTPTPTPTFTPTATASSSYTSTDGTYSVGYPNGWISQSANVSQAPGATIFASLDLKNAAAVVPLSTTIPVASYGERAKSILSSIGATDITVNVTTRTATFPSGTWSVVQGTATVSTVSDTFTVYGQDHGAGTFLVVTFGPTASVDADNTAYFTPMLNSLKFLK
jgi:hypothetical protein